MIGNKIEFIYFDKYLKDDKGEYKEGIVVDAFTKVSGTITGNSEVFLGFGGGVTSGSTSSNRMYKVEFFGKYDMERKYPTLTDIHDWQLKRIISFANDSKQEINEEKIITA